jgi:hypothetical protein
LDEFLRPPNIPVRDALQAEMRATTIRFPNDLWDQLEREARKQGVSVAQYVREAALYRVAYAAGAATVDEDAEVDPRRVPPPNRFKR